MKKQWIYITVAAVALAAVALVIFLTANPTENPSGNTQTTGVTEQTTLATQETQESTAATEDTEPSTEVTEPAEPVILEKYLPTYQQNNDLVGWISIAGTKLDNPVLQTGLDRLNYYIDKNFEGKPSASGALYIREYCDVFKPSDNLVIYGHNMKNGTMFGSLKKYRDQQYWQDNQYIRFDTLYEEHTYQIFAVFAISADPGYYPYHRFNDAANAEEFNEFIQIVTNSPDADKSITKKIKYYYSTGITPQYGDKLITLSTCEYTQGDNGRLVVVAYRVS